MGRIRIVLVAVVALVLLAAIQLPPCHGLEALKAAAISRDIRMHYRRSGFNWISPKMMQESIDLQTNTKPIMYLFTMQSCSNCRDLMNEFDTLDHLRLSQLSAQFLAVLVLDDYNLQYGADYAPKGFAEVPRIVFADPNGKLRPEFTNPKSDETSAWFYSSAQEVIDRIRTVLQHYQAQPLSLARPGIRTPDVDSDHSSPSSSVLTEGGVLQFKADLDLDLPS